MKKEAIVIGWREWIHLSDLGVRWIKAKVDTGARTSALHAEDIEYFRLRGRDWVRFTVHPVQRSKLRPTRVSAEVLEMRKIRSSNGSQELRPVIETTIDVGDEEWTIEITLTSRDVMGFRMLLGRQAVREHTIIDAGRSYVTRKKPRKSKVAKKPAAKRKTTRRD